MANLTAVIGSTSVTVLGISENNTMDGRSVTTLTLYDAAGTQDFPERTQVTINDTLNNYFFSGYVVNDQKTPMPNGVALTHAVSCVDETDIPVRHYYSGPEWTNRYAGDIVTDLVAGPLSADGITASYAIDEDKALSDFQQGTQSNTAAVATATGGALQLALAGTAVTKKESATADFSAGTLSNVQALSNTLTLTSHAAAQFTGTCTGYQGVGGASASVGVFTGPYSIVTGDSLQYTIWIASTSPQIMASVDGICSDGSTIGTFAPSFSHQIRDQNGLWASPAQDLTGYANNQWYSRTIDLSLLNGKTLSLLTLSFAGSNPGQYTAYFYGLVIKNGGTTKLSIPFVNNTGLKLIIGTAVSQQGYTGSTVSAVTAYDPTGTRISPATSLTPVGCLGQSLISYQATLPTSTQAGASSTIAIYTSTDNATWQLVTNLAAIPSLIVGASSSGVSLYFKEVLTILGPDPTIAPILTNVTATIQPTYTNVNTDWIKTVSTQAGWNAGTLTGLTAQSNNDLTLQNAQSRNWDDASIASQTLFGSGTATQGTVNRNLDLTSNTGNDARSRFDFAGAVNQFDESIAVQVPAAGANIGLEWATTSWANGLNSFAYNAYITTTQIKFVKGTNGTAGAETGLVTVTFASALNTGDWHILRVKWGQSANQVVVYLDGIQYISTTDATYPSNAALAYVGARYYNNTGSNGTGYFDNFALVQTLSSNLYTSQSLTGLGNVGTVQDSRLFWQSDEPQGTAILAQVSVNGAAYANATNGAVIPGLTKGLSVTGQHLNVKFTFNSTDPTLQPVLHGYTAWVTSQYSSSGNRISVPLLLAPVGNAGNTGVTWTGVQPPNTTIFVDTGTDGVNWTPAGSGISGQSSVAGIFSQTDPVVDQFTSNTSSNYTSTCRTGGSIAPWVWDTANKRLSVSGGVNAHLLYNSPVVGSDVDESFVMDTSDNGGFVWRWIDQGDHYSLAIHDASSPNNPNTVQLYVVTGGGGGTITPLTEYYTNQTSATVGTAKQLSETLGAGAFTTKQSTIGTANGIGELYAAGTTNPWAAAGSLLAPSDNGFIDDSTALEGQTLIGGIYTPTVRLGLNLTATITADIYLRISKRASGGAHTLIGDCLLSGQTITGTTATYTFPGTNLSSMAFATGDRLCFNYQLNVLTNANGQATLACKIGESSIANTGLTTSQVATPGFQATGAGGATTLLGSAAITFVRTTPHAFRVIMVGSNITISMDGTLLLNQSDSTITGAGFAGMRNDNAGGASSATFYLFRLQYYGQDVTGTQLFSRVRFTSTDPTVTPQLTQLSMSVHDPAIQNGALIPQTNYSVLNGNRMTIAQICDDLIKQCGFTTSSTNFWWKIINNQMTFQQHQATPAPWVLTPQGATSVDIVDSPAPMIDNVNPTYRNSQWGTGGIDIVAITPKSFVGNGTQTTFDCGFPIDSITSITLNGATQTFGLSNVSTGLNWYYTQGQSTVVQDTSGTPLIGSQTLTVAFNAQVSITANVQNPTEIARIEGIDGTTGIIDEGEDMSGLNKQAMIAKCSGLVNQFGQKNQTLTFTTNRAGLAVGQLLPVFASPLGVFAGAFLLIQVKIGWRVVGTGGGAIMQSPRFECQGVSGPQVLGWLRYLSRLGVQ